MKGAHSEGVTTYWGKVEKDATTERNPQGRASEALTEDSGSHRGGGKRSARKCLN